jgi:hypothetical protein
VRGLNLNRQPLLKAIFKGAATLAETITSSSTSTGLSPAALLPTSHAGPTPALCRLACERSHARVLSGELRRPTPQFIALRERLALAENAFGFSG